MDLLLTDDEVAAVAAMTGGVWPSPLPTVDVRDPEALLSATFRGMRSLEVRNLIGADGLASDELADAAIVPPRLDMTCVFLAKADLNRAAWRYSSTHYRETDGWLVEGVDSIGVHRLGRVTGAERREALRSLFEAACSGSLDAGETSEASRLVVMEVRDGRPTAVVTAQPGGLARGEVDLDGDQIVVRGELAGISLADALETVAAQSEWFGPGAAPNSDTPTVTTDGWE